VRLGAVERVSSDLALRNEVRKKGPELPNALPSGIADRGLSAHPRGNAKIRCDVRTAKEDNNQSLVQHL